MRIVIDKLVFEGTPADLGAFVRALGEQLAAGAAPEPLPAPASAPAAPSPKSTPKKGAKTGSSVATALEARMPGAGKVWKLLLRAGESGMLASDAMQAGGLGPRSSGPFLSAVRGLVRERGLAPDALLRTSRESTGTRLFAVGDGA